LGAGFLWPLQQGIYLPPSPFEAAFLSAAHMAEDVEALI
jgi:glutamate-1-semialdehyde aminotransferase